MKKNKPNPFGDMARVTKILKPRIVYTNPPKHLPAQLGGYLSMRDQLAVIINELRDHAAIEQQLRDEIEEEIDEVTRKTIRPDASTSHRR